MNDLLKHGVRVLGLYFASTIITSLLFGTSFFKLLMFVPAFVVTAIIGRILFDRISVSKVLNRDESSNLQNNIKEPTVKSDPGADDVMYFTPIYLVHCVCYCLLFNINIFCIASYSLFLYMCSYVV
ncbi:hypothetical protein YASMINEVIRUS_1429 [Yasminevirus sp. GU-2018]|uniref:Uncharacterized protein n=1 Tax=Yasminevirus sp. GU-2018 TaxID=2420051 RepID=A0A5K0UA76_9VIRU|nr:hypothetical protein YASMINEVIRUS_1429 [Yasminevirus sp. GU-2018]